jgi:hypothetical protein
MKKASDSAKELAKKKAAKRTDAAGRSGMGESANSNLYHKGMEYSAANLNAKNAYNKTLRSTGNRQKAVEALDKNFTGAFDYSESKRKK